MIIFFIHPLCSLHLFLMSWNLDGFCTRSWARPVLEWHTCVTQVWVLKSEHSVSWYKGRHTKIKGSRKTIETTILRTTAHTNQASIHLVLSYVLCQNFKWHDSNILAFGCNLCNPCSSTDKWIMGRVSNTAAEHHTTKAELVHEPQYIIPSIGNLTEGKSCVFNKASYVTVLRTTVYRLHSANFH